MASILMRAHLVDVKAACGHMVWAFVPPSSGRPGPVGRRNIEQARRLVCPACRDERNEIQAGLAALDGKGGAK